MYTIVQSYANEKSTWRNWEFEIIRKLEEDKRKEMEEIIEEEPAVQDDVQDDVVNKYHYQHFIMISSLIIIEVQRVKLTFKSWK